MATQTLCVVLVQASLTGGHTLSATEQQRPTTCRTLKTIHTGETGRLAGCTHSAVGIQASRTAVQTAAFPQERSSIFTAVTVIRRGGARQAVLMAGDRWMAFRAALPLPRHSEGPSGAGGAGALIAGHMAIPTLTLPTRTITHTLQVSKTSEILHIGFHSLFLRVREDTGADRWLTLRATFSI